MTEENARPGDAGRSEVPPADATPDSSTPGTVPPASPTPDSPPPGAGTSSRLSGAGQQLSASAARLGRWIRRQSPVRIGAAVVALGVVGLLVWLLAATLGGSKPPAAEGSTAVAAASTPSAPASRGPLPLDGVSPMDFQLGDCFKDFDPDAPQSTVVACATGHAAQLVAVEHYAAPDSYPGRDELKQRARSACKAAPLAAKSSDYDLSYKLAYPSSSSWEKGDRRVDCYVIAGAGNVIKESLLP